MPADQRAWPRPVRRAASLSGGLLLKMWIASASPAATDGSDTKQTLPLRDKSAKASHAPRGSATRCSATHPPRNAAEARDRVVRSTEGADGLKILGVDAIACPLGRSSHTRPRVEHHSRRRNQKWGYQVKDNSSSLDAPHAASAGGRQSFPSSYNYNNEVDRFRYAAVSGARRTRTLTKVLEAMLRTSWWDRPWNLRASAIYSARKPSVVRGGSAQTPRKYFNRIRRSRLRTSSLVLNG